MDKTCLCKICTEVSPRIRDIKKALPENLQKDFEWLMDDYCQKSNDLDIANAKLNGDWPKWEFMKKFLPVKKV